MKLIPLTQNQFAIVDDDSFESLSKYKWHALKFKAGFVACRMERLTVGIDGRKRIYMHRQIMGFNHSSLPLIDHKDHNTLNNQKGNLRLATHAQNRHNSRANNEVKTSKYLGVSYDKGKKKYRVALVVKGKQKTIGRFKTEIAAAKAYNDAAKIHYGEFAIMNQI